MTAQRRRWLGAFFFALMFGHLGVNTYSAWLNLATLPASSDGWTASLSPDGRAQIVRRTARGWAVNRTARDVVAAVQAEWTAAIGEERMALLLDVLRDLVTALGVEYTGSVSEVSTRTIDTLDS